MRGWRLAGRLSALGTVLGVTGLLVLGVGPKPSASQLFPQGPVPVPVEVTALRGFDRTRPERTDFGPLRYLGGIEIRSEFQGFGGLSGLLMRPDGSGFTAISDAGYWLTADLTHEGERPSGIAGARMGPLLGEDGVALSRRSAADAEALTRLPDGDLLVSLERRNALRRYPFGRNGITARGRAVTAPAGISRLRGNRGLEALGACPDGRLVGIAEAARESRAQGWIWRLGADARSFSAAVPGGFAVTDLACLERDEILLLERRYVPLFDLAVRLRRLSLAQLEAGEAGETLLEADLGSTIDNFEGLGVHRHDGRLILTLVSDDNYSMLQRTLLLQFELRL